MPFLLGLLGLGLSYLMWCPFRINVWCSIITNRSLIGRLKDYQNRIGIIRWELKKSQIRSTNEKRTKYASQSP